MLLLEQEHYSRFQCGHSNIGTIIGGWTIKKRGPVPIRKKMFAVILGGGKDTLGDSKRLFYDALYVYGRAKTLKNARSIARLNKTHPPRNVVPDERN